MASNSNATILDAFTQQVMFADRVILEKNISVLLRPKPRWLPARIWRKLIHSLLTIEETS